LAIESRKATCTIKDYRIARLGVGNIDGAESAQTAYLTESTVPLTVTSELVVPVQVLVAPPLSVKVYVVPFEITETNWLATLRLSVRVVPIAVCLLAKVVLLKDSISIIKNNMMHFGKIRCVHFLQKWFVLE
jgi:hypothetical protein